jgi:hypothetical protein
MTIAVMDIALVKLFHPESNSPARSVYYVTWSLNSIVTERTHLLTFVTAIMCLQHQRVSKQQCLDDNVCLIKAQLWQAKRRYPNKKKNANTKTSKK